MAMRGLGQNLTIEEAGSMIRQVDADGDGRVTYKEFSDLMLK
jgi:Ca2+-binding EF-hand superfamily protein